MNIHLREVICTSKDGDRFWRTPECYIRGNTIKYLRVPDEAILLRRGSEHEGSEGLYSLNMNSHSGNESCSCTVAFEDRGDASHFCYLLESFFEGLGDFSADAVPLSTGDLEEGAKSEGVKVLVVRKGQIQIYVGQPLADVERSLRSISK